MSDVFAGFERLRIDGKDVWRGGTGPAVIVIHEMPGLHPGVVAFARRLVDAGFTAWLPSLFGRPGQPFSAGLPMLRSSLRVCVSREFHVFALNRTSPVVGWLRSLAARAHAECGGPGVGTVGMCFTGGFALAMAVDQRVLAPVLSQPGLPAPIGARRKAVHPGPGGTRGAVRDAASGTGRGVPGSRDRLVTGQPVRHSAECAFGPDRATGRRAGTPDPGRAGPRPGVLPGAAARRLVAVYRRRGVQPGSSASSSSVSS